MKLSELRKKLSKKRKRPPKVHTERRGGVDVEYSFTSTNLNGNQSSLTDWDEVSFGTTGEKIDGEEVKTEDRLFLGIDPGSPEGDHSSLIKWGSIEEVKITLGEKYERVDALPPPTYGLIRLDSTKPLGAEHRRRKK